VPAGDQEADTLADELHVCATLGNNSERLACYDRLAANAAARSYPAAGFNPAPPQEAAPGGRVTKVRRLR